MKKTLKMVSLAMSLAFVAPSVVMAAESSIDIKIRELDEKIARLEEEYKTYDKLYDDVKKNSKAYIDKDGNYVSSKKAAEKELFEVSNKLDSYVTNVVPSLEQAMLGVYFRNGAKLDGYTIRAKNANDLYEYLKGYFVVKEGTNKAVYDALLIDYVNAISDNVTVPEYSSARSTILDERWDKKKELDEAKALRKYYLREKDKDLIKRLEEAVAKSEITIKTCENLFKYSPKTIAPVRAKLERMLKEQKDIVRRSKLALEKYK